MEALPDRLMKLIDLTICERWRHYGYKYLLDSCARLVVLL